MCGIAGILDWAAGPIHPQTIVRMTQALHHRGPDGVMSRVLSCGALTLGLGHARLKIIDLSRAAAQPMANDDESVWIVFNGEIYNFQELRLALTARGIRFRSSSDTEVILRLYEAEGSSALSALEGMFALAIWDGRRRRLLLARDRVGKKPLFYRSLRSQFAFASEIKALLQHPEIPAEVDPSALPSFFAFGYVPTPATFYRGIRQLPPAHLLEVDHQGRERLERYWTLPVAGGSVSRRAPSEREAQKRVRWLVEAAVRRRLVADVPLGAFLSGGIDSSVVVGVMSRLLREPVRTFSIGFSADAQFDETAYALMAARQFKTLHTKFVVEPFALDEVERLIWHHDGPFADSSALPTFALARLARQHVTVALNGDGGDELFAGYLRFYAAVLAERVPLWARRAAHRLLGVVPQWGSARGALRRAQKFAGSAALPFLERFVRWNAVFYEDLPQLLPPETLRAWPGADAFCRVHLEGAKEASALTRLLLLNLKTYLVDDLLVKMDRCSMAHGLETRSPLLDRELMEYVSQLPDGMKLRFGRTKRILRMAFADLLPRPILRRGKMGFGVPLRRWFRGDLRRTLHETLLSPSAHLRGYLNQNYVRALSLAHDRGVADHTHRLWTLLTFELWLRSLRKARSEMRGELRESPMPQAIQGVH